MENGKAEYQISQTELRGWQFIAITLKSYRCAFRQSRVIGLFKQAALIKITNLWSHVSENKEQKSRATDQSKRIARCHLTSNVALQMPTSRQNVYFSKLE